MEQNKNAWIAVFVAVALIILFGSFGMGGYGMMGFGMGFGWVFMLLFWGVVIWLVYTLINAAQTKTQENKQDNAVEILKKRYAKGEITKKQYEEMRKELLR
jgi:putative membrane protein